MARHSPYPQTVDRLIEEFAKLPGIGKRSAERLAFHTLSAPRDEAMALALAIRDARKNLRACSRCFHIAEGELCAVCSDPERDATQMCVVELPRDAIALEKADVYNGVYHVLQGRLSPAEGVGPDNLRIRELLVRLRDAAEQGGAPVREIILATRPSAEGDATAEYLSQTIREKIPGIAVTRLARGLASGADLENAAPSSLVFAFQGRRRD
ncbi:MAG: recombination mediator RecR [Planctomycetota bacterium]|jgi:recombination protein RecR|nr:recombination mediator RecR [Planctomycetota bacterium]